MKYLPLILLLLLVSCKKPLTITRVTALTDRVSYVANEYDGDTLPQLHDAQLEKAGVLKNGRFVENSLTDFKDNTVITGQGLKPLKITVQENYKVGTIKLFSSESSDTITIGLGTHLPAIGLADVIPGGYKEIVVYNHSYIMNGTNYYLDVYEVK